MRWKAERTFAFKTNGVVKWGKTGESGGKFLLPFSDIFLQVHGILQQFIQWNCCCLSSNLFVFYLDHKTY